VATKYWENGIKNLGQSVNQLRTFVLQNFS